MKRAFIVAVFLARFCLGTDGIAQDARIDESDYNAISREVQTLFTAGYQIVGEVRVDSSSQHRMYAGSRIENPFGMLNGCIIFVAEGLHQGGNYAPKSFLGIYRDGRIICWSDTVMPGETLALPVVFGTGDLIHHHAVDVLISWLGGTSQSAEYLWIFEWNGNHLDLVNDVDSTGLSNLVSVAGTFQLTDLNGDGISEIEGKWPVPDSSILYTWNGSAYGRWNSGIEPSPESNPPRDRITGNVKCRVVRSNGNLTYDYTVVNGAESLQKIDEFLVKCDTGVVVANPLGPREWRFSMRRSNFLGWTNWFSLPNNIEPGAQDSSFSFQASTSPGIRSCYLRGANYSPGTHRNDQAARAQDILDNSFILRTLSPVNPSPNFEPIIFLDTLRSYIDQSRTLGWIADQSTADLYSRLIDSAQKSLAANKIRTVRSCLQSAIQQSVQDSAKSISSEAYALIRFNAEYLVGQLPPLPPGYTLTTSMSGRGSVVRTPDAAEYDSASTIVLSASPDSAYRFAGWSGDVSSTDNPLAVQIVCDITVSAAFVPPTPSLSAISPALTLPGSSPITLTLSGRDFLDGATVKWNGSPRPTTVVSHSILKSTIPAGDLSAADSVAITACNPGGKDSDPITFSIVQTLPFGLRPDLDDITKNRDGSSTAWFGYRNDNSVDIFVPVGASNMVTPSPSDRGQPTLFLPGKREKVFSVRFTGGSLKWTLNGKTETAIGKQNKGQ